jgi:hypothetical protein
MWRLTQPTIEVSTKYYELHYHVFVVAGIKYLPWLEPATRRSKMWKVATALEAEAIPGKAKGAKKWRRASSRDGDKTSERELLLVKPLNPSMKLAAKDTKVCSLGMSTAKKALAAKVLAAPSSATKGGMRKEPSTSADQGG